MILNILPPGGKKPKTNPNWNIYTLVSATVLSFLPTKEIIAMQDNETQLYLKQKNR